MDWIGCVLSAEEMKHKGHDVDVLSALQRVSFYDSLKNGWDPLAEKKKTYSVVQDYPKLKNAGYLIYSCVDDFVDIANARSDLKKFLDVGASVNISDVLVAADLVLHKYLLTGEKLERNVPLSEQFYSLKVVSENYQAYVEKLFDFRLRTIDRFNNYLMSVF